MGQVIVLSLSLLSKFNCRKVANINTTRNILPRQTRLEQRRLESSDSISFFFFGRQSQVGGSVLVLHHLTLSFCPSEAVICTSVDYRQHPGEMIRTRGCCPLLLAVTCVCFSGGLMWSFQDEDASGG